MTAADGIRSLEQRAALLAHARWFVAAIAALVVLLVAGSCWDAHRIAGVRGEEKILEQQIAVANRQRLEASHDVAIAHASVDSAKHATDSVISRANVVEARSHALATQVRIVSPGALAVRLTPNGTDTVIVVPPPVTAYIASLESTVAAKDTALQALAGQVATTQTETAALRRELAADSVVIATQAQEITVEKHARPKLGFKAGASAVGLLVLLFHFVK